MTAIGVNTKARTGLGVRVRITTATQHQGLEQGEGVYEALKCCVSQLCLWWWTDVTVLLSLLVLLTFLLHIKGRVWGGRSSLPI